jgi:hypothetical protein
MKEYWHILATDPPPAPPLYKPVAIPECELEIRQAASQKRVALVPLAGALREMGRPDAEQVRRIGNLPDGEYAVALVAAGKRCSNVARVVIDSKFDPAKLPALQLVPTLLVPGGGQLHVAVVGTGRTPVDPEFTNASILWPVLIVDGVERKFTGPMAIHMPVGPLQSGQRDQRWLQLDGYEPKIDPAASHTIAAKVGKYESAPVTVPADGSLDAAWDKTTAALAPAPAPHISVRGTVTGPDGKPAAGYEVGLVHDIDYVRFDTHCDAKGAYEFLNIAAGPYTLNTNPPAQGTPLVTAGGVQVEAGKTVVRKFVYSGHVKYADGTPAAGLTVSATGSLPAEKTEWDTPAETNAQSVYTVRAPYPVADYIGLSGVGRQPQPYHDVKAGRMDLDFVAPGPPPAAH